MAESDFLVRVLAPTGRDGVLTVKLLEQAGLAGNVCDTMTQLCENLREGAGAVLVAEEALSPKSLELFTDALAAQESWSDVPVVVFTSGAKLTAALQARVESIVAAVGNTIFLERPVRALTLITAVKNALRARRRQYHVRSIMLQQAQKESEAREAVRFLQQLLGIVSHDLRNPISAVLISAESLLRRGGLTEKQQRGLHRIVQAGQRTNTMILDLLDFTRARLGREMPLHVVECDMGALTRQLIDELAAAHPGRQIHFEPHGNLAGQWDRGRIAQIIQNIVGNALQYSTEDHPVTVRLHPRGQEQLVLSVNNYGAIIDPDQRQRIFEPMERGSTSVETPVSESGSRSVGLGLYIVKQIVMAHAGTISVTSNADQGTTFEVSLPRRLVRDNPRMSL